MVHRLSKKDVSKQLLLEFEAASVVLQASAKTMHFIKNSQVRSDAIMNQIEMSGLGVVDLAPLAARIEESHFCLLYTSPSPRDGLLSRMPSSA